MAAGLGTLLALLAVGSSHAGGGDNDSPYNMPNRGDTGDTGGEHGTLTASLSILDILVETGGDAKAQQLDPNRASLATLSDDVRVTTNVPSSGDHPVGTSAIPTGALVIDVTVHSGEQLTYHVLGSEALLQGRFSIVSDVPVTLLPSLLPGQTIAFILVGQSSTGTSLDTVDFAASLPVIPSSGIDLSWIAQKLARVAVFEGKTAQILLVRTQPDAGLSPVLEATVTLEVNETLTATIDIEEF